MQSEDDAIIGAWRDEIISNPNLYVLARVGEVKSKPKFGPFNERLNHSQIQKDMILIAAHAIADATTWIAFLPTTDEKIETLNGLIKYYKRQKKSTWKNEQENMDDKIKKITAIDIFIIMWKDLKSRLQTAADTRRPGFFDRMTQSVQSFTSRTRHPTTKSTTKSTTEYEMMGGSKRRKTRKTRKSKKSKTRKSKKSNKIRRTKSRKSRRIRRTRKSRL